MAASIVPGDRASERTALWARRREYEAATPERQFIPRPDKHLVNDPQAVHVRPVRRVVVTERPIAVDVHQDSVFGGNCPVRDDEVTCR
jgi:hypothetical protein